MTPYRPCEAFPSASAPPFLDKSGGTGDQMGWAMAEQRGSLKSLREWQRERRRKALEGVRERRSKAREEELRRKREIHAVGELELELDRNEEGAGVVVSLGRQQNRPGYLRSREACKRYAAELLAMEWLVDVPEDLWANWYVTPRPEGPRCLLISQAGSTVSRCKNGSVHKEFQSALPNGSRGTRSPGTKGSKCVLDAVYHAPTSTFYVTDCITWEDYSLVDCDFEFRSFWLAQKFEGVAPGGVREGEPALMLAPRERATREMISRAYSGEEGLGYTRDGLIFTHKDSTYVQGGRPTPLCLQWKDAHCSRYPIDTDAKGVVLETQRVVLQLQEDARSVGTGDDPPVVLGKIPKTFSDNNADKLRPGQLFRFNLGPRGFDFGADGRPMGASLELAGLSHKRAKGDIISRILFQHLLRTGQITFESLVRE
ncbi:snurportin-1 [Chloropicon primus]|uniref:Snurportin-1 n=1 Tax=Chloropicon primus TaxID=1764295 RepID=A0A5B8MKZ8_9CHLO|nr:snurportin-1 [Chloropicon primus]UPR00161.1 snurportin-1 [Chloropicon primus]|eukprot:QDZ20951.1 snurportin-1 [Chloropicon primus]